MAEKQWDVSFDERRRIEARSKLRAVLKEQYLKEVTNPHIMRSGQQGVPFDPALQRWIAMKATKYQYYKTTPYNVFFYLGTVVAPIIFVAYFVKVSKDDFEAKCRSGEIPYKDRQFKFA